MTPTLRNRLIIAGGAGAIAIAGAMRDWYEGDGPTVVRAGVTYHRVYNDTGGVPTVCRGVTGADVIPGKLYTRAECEVLERKHLAAAEADARRLIARYDQLNQWQQAALIDFAYNLGASALEGSTMRRKFNAGDMAGGCDELSRWVNGRVKGQLVKLPGLVDRRGTAEELCLNWGQ